MAAGILFAVLLPPMPAGSDGTAPLPAERKWQGRFWEVFTAIRN